MSSVAVVRDGEVEDVYGIARDVAERERLERELRESEERYRFLVENSPDVIYATDADGRITYFSESVERVLGWVPQEVVGRHFRDIVRTSDGIPAGRRFAELAGGSAPLTTRMELQDKDGTFRQFEVTASAMRLDGVFSGVHGSARDIRERERLERELRESEERYRYLVQSSPGPRVDDRRGRRSSRSCPTRPSRSSAGSRRSCSAARSPTSPRTRAGAGRSRGSGGSSGGPPRRIARGSTSGPATGASWRWRSRASGWSRTAGSSGRTARPATSRSGSGWSAASGARPRSSPRPRSARTSPASSTTR